MKRLLLLLCCAVVVCARAAADSERSFRTYPLLVSRAESIVEALQDTVGDDGRIFHDRANSRLLVSATPEAHERIRQLLQEINVPARNVRIEVTFAEAGEQTDTRAGIEGSGSVVVGPGGTDVDVRIRPYLQHRETSSTRSTRQTLLVQSGAEGLLRVGEQVPFAEWIVEFGRRWGYIEKRVALEDVGARLRVSPRIVEGSDLVHIAITPELTALAGGRRRHIRYTGVSTEVTVRDGQTVSLGGANEHQDFYDRFLVGVNAKGVRKRLDIRLTPTILAP